MPTRFYFVRECLNLPYMSEMIPKEQEESKYIGQDEYDYDPEYTYANNLKQEERDQIYFTIKDQLCQSQYACAMVLQNFQLRSGKTFSKAQGYDNDDDPI